MPLATLAQLGKVKGKRVLVRVDFNVPLGKHGEIDGDGDSRIRASLPTIQHLSKLGAKVIIVTHLGRPEGRDKKLSLAPVAERLANLMGAEVRLISANVEDEALMERHLGLMDDGDVTMLENIRYYKGEDANSVFLARRLASLADVFVNDAFAVAHREAASTVGVAGLLPSYAGFLMAREVESLSRLLQRPRRPFVVVMGGAKINSKLPTLQHLLSLADKVLIGGGMANNFFAAMGFGTGTSLVSPDDVQLAKDVLAANRQRIMLPTDVLVAERSDEQAHPRYRRPDEIGPRECVVDIGAETIREWAGVLKEASTIIWNGPLGLFEVPKFSHGSVMIGRVIAGRSSGKAFGVVGGGETVQALLRTGMDAFVDHVSTGGGAMLEFLSGKKLPGIAPLMRATVKAPRVAKKVVKKKVAAKKKPVAKKAAAKKKRP